RGGGMAVRDRIRTGAILAGATPLQLGVVLFLFALAFRFFDAIFRTLLIGYAAAILAIALNVLVRRLPVERKWAALLVGTVVVVLLIAGLYFGGSLLLDQLRGLMSSLPQVQAE